MESINNKHIDLTYLKEIANNSNEFILQMISIFMIQTPEAIANLEHYLKTKDWKALKGIAHKMKPSFSFMGIKELENTIALVEAYCENEINLEELPAMILKIKTICALALTELEIEKKVYE